MEKRSYDRKLINKPFKFDLVNKEKTVETMNLQGRILNISRGGIYFVCSFELNVGEEILLRINSESIIKINGIILRKENKDHGRMEFGYAVEYRGVSEFFRNRVLGEILAEIKKL